MGAEYREGMIHTIKGDLLTAKGIIIHQVNCQGVMGAGVAKAIKQKWPQVYKEYADYTKDHLVEELIGSVYWVELGDVWVGNCYAQVRYGHDASRYTSYDALDSCMMEVARVAPQFPGSSINFPLIGCGLAGGHWPVVREIIEYRIPDTFTKNLWVP